MTPLRFELKGRGGGRLVIACDDGLNDVYFSAYGPRGGRKAYAFLAQGARPATNVAGFMAEITAMLAGAPMKRRRPTLYLGDFTLYVEADDEVPADADDFKLHIFGRKGGHKWTEEYRRGSSTRVENTLEGLRRALDAARLHLMPGG